MITAPESKTKSSVSSQSKSEWKLPQLVTELPGPNAKQVLEQDAKFMSPSYTRDYPLVAKRGRGAVVEDVDGNRFLDFAAGIAVCSTGHCHPKVVAAIQEQAAELIHISGTDFYYENMPRFAEKLAATVPGSEAKKVFFTNSGTEAGRGRGQAGALCDEARQIRRVLWVLSRALHGFSVVDGVEIHAAQGIWRVTKRHRAHSLSICIPLRSWPHRRNLRRGNSGAARRANFQAAF